MEGRLKPERNTLVVYCTAKIGPRGSRCKTQHAWQIGIGQAHKLDPKLRYAEYCGLAHAYDALSLTASILMSMVATYLRAAAKTHPQRLRSMTVDFQACLGHILGL
eukprot:6115996-Amphidinium_carterae.1